MYICNHSVIGRVLPSSLPPSRPRRRPPPFLPFSLLLPLFPPPDIRKEMLIREMGEERVEEKGHAASKQVIHKIDIPANRYTHI